MLSAPLFCVNLASSVDPVFDSSADYAEAPVKMRSGPVMQRIKLSVQNNSLQFGVITMESDLAIRLVLVDPPAGVDFGIQRGGGSDYETLFVQQAKRGDVIFDFSLVVADNRKNGLPNLKGPIAQGPPSNRFVYVDVGTYAGQENTQWSRRMKVPLQGITWELVKQVTNKPGHRLLARIPGRGKDGGPNCATVKLVSDWKVIKQ